MLFISWLILVIYQIIITEQNNMSVIAFKYISDIQLAESREFHIIYTIYNTANSEITDIELQDEMLPVENFTQTKSNNFKWKKILPFTNVSVSIPVVPKRPCYANISFATVTFHTGDSNETKIAVTNFVGIVPVIPLQMYLRQHSSHLYGWLLTAVFLVPSLLIPYIKWVNVKYLLKTSQRKNE